MNRGLFDTDVIIDYLKGHEKAVGFFQSYRGDFYVSAITIAELYSGLKGEKEKSGLVYFLSLFDVIPISKDIAAEAGLLRRKWHRSHGMGLADALIAATAASHNMTLYSLNEKHYGMLDILEVPYLK